MEGGATEQDLENEPKIEEEFDKFFDMPTTSTQRRKTSLHKGCLFTRRNLKVTGLKFSTVKKGRREASSRNRDEELFFGVFNLRVFVSQKGMKFIIYDIYVFHKFVCLLSTAN